MDSDQPRGDTLLYGSPNATLGSESSIPVAPMPTVSEPLVQSQYSQSAPVSLASSETEPVEPEVHETVEKLKLLRFNKSAALATGIALTVIVTIGVVSVLIANSAKNNSASSSNSSVEQNYKTQKLGVGNVSGYNQLLTGRAQDLTVNGQLSVSNSLVLAPSNTPTHPTLGQLYYNSGNNTPYFYNGKNFVSLIPAASLTIAGSNASLSLGSGLSLQGSNLINSGVTSIKGTPNQVVVSSSNGAVQVSLPSSINTNSITSGVLNSLSLYEVNGIPLSSANLSDGGNLAKLTGSGPQAFTGNNVFTGQVIDQNATNSTNAFSIQNAAGANIFTANTANSAVNIGQGASLDSTNSTNGTPPSSMALASNYSYVLSNTSNTLQIFNVSNPAIPSLVSTTSTGNHPAGVTVSGSFAYIVNSNDNTLQIFNVSNPAIPSLVSTTATNNCPDGITASGNYLYVLNGCSNNMQIFNVSNPAIPSLVSTTVTGQQPTAVSVSGNYVYLVNSNDNTLQIFNVSNPASPVPEHTTITGSCPTSVQASGNYAYVISSCSSTFQIFDVSNPASPTLISTTITGRYPYALSILGNYAYITNDNDNTLEVFDVSKPANPITADTITTGSCPEGVGAANGYAYVINNCDDSFQVFSVLTNVNVNVEGNLSVSQIISGSTLSLQGTNSNTSSTETADLITNNDFTNKSAWSTSNSSSPYFVATSGSYAYVVNQNDTTLQVFNISNSLSPSIVSTTTLGGVPASVAVSGNYAYVVNIEPYGTSSTMQVVDISNPASPTIVDTITLYGNPVTVAISGTYAYVEGAGGGAGYMDVFSLSTPATPVLAGSVAIARNYDGYITVSGNYAYIVNSDYSEFQVIDISNPASPTLISTTSTGTYPYSMAVSGNYAYVVNNSSSTLQIFNVSSPSSPTLVSTTATSYNPTSIAVSGNYAYITDYSSTLEVFDISNPASPIPVASQSTGNYPAFITLSGNYAYVVNTNDSALQIFDISNPLSPALDSTIGTGLTSWSLTPTSATCISNYCANLFTTNQFSSVPGASYEVQFTTSGASGKQCYVSVGNSSPATACYSEGTQDVVVQASNTSGLSINLNGNNGISITNIKVYRINPATSSLQILNYMGQTALAVSTPGNNSEFIGVSSGLNSNSSSNNNTGVGDLALQNNTSGYGNTALGYAALQSNTTGGYNTAIGFDALSNNTTGLDNTAIGAFSSIQSGLQNATAIGYYAQANENNSLVLGNAVSVGIGTSTPVSTLNVVDQGGYVDNFTANSTSYTSYTGGSITQGLSASWYNSTSTNNAYQIPGNGTLAYSGTDGPINWTNLLTTRPAGVNSTYINAQWTGYLYAPATGQYDLCTESDDGSRIYLSNTEVVNNWYTQGDMERCSYVNLVANTWYPITVEYYQGGGSADMYLQWYESDVDGGTFENIPAADLSSTEPTGQIYTSGFSLAPTLTVQGDTNTYDGIYGIQPVVIGVKNSNGAIVDGLTSNGSLQGSNAQGLNSSGGNIAIAGGQGTGSANGGSINFQIAPAGTSGLSNNSLLTVASISGIDGSALFENSINSTSAFNIQDSSGGNVLTANTTNDSLVVGAQYGSQNANKVTLQVNGAVQQTGMYTPDTGSSNYNEWTELGYCNITAQYNGCQTSIVMNGDHNSSITTPDQAILNFAAYQQTAMGSEPYVNVLVENNIEALTSSDFAAVVTQDNSSATIIQLWFKNPQGYDTMDYAPILSFDTPMAWTPNTAYQASLPVGSQTTYGYIGDVTASSALIQSITNSTTALQVQNSSASNIFTVDTADGRVGVGMGVNTPGNLLSVGALTTAAGTYQIAVSTNGTTNSGIIVQDVASQSSGYAFMLQDGTGASLASIDYQGNLSVKSILANGNLTVNGHVISGNSSGVTTVTPTVNVGSTGTCSLSAANYAASNDSAGMIVITPGGTGITTDTQCTVTFSSAYSSYPHVIISPASAASEARGAYAASTTNNSFNISFTSVGSAGVSYYFNYYVVQ